MDTIQVIGEDPPRPAVNLCLCHVGDLKFTTGETLANDKPSAMVECTLALSLLAVKDK